MPFKPGQSGNKGGRPKGSANRTSEEVRQTLLKILDDNLIKLQKDIDKMSEKDRAYLLINLARHCTAPALNIEKLSEAQILQVIQYYENTKKS